MKLTSESIVDQQWIPARYAFGKIDPQSHVTLAQNVNPQLARQGAPQETKSFAVICHDVDVPSKPDDVTQEQREIPSDLPRVDFYPCALVDIAADTAQIAAGAYSNGITPRRTDGPLAPNAPRPGINDFTCWSAAGPA